MYLNLIMDERELERILDEAFQSVIQTNFPQASTILERIGEHITRNDSVGGQSTNSVSTNGDNISHDISYSEVPIQDCSVQSTNTETTNQSTNTTNATTNATTNTTTNATTSTSNTNVNTTTTNIPFVQSHAQQPNTHILDITHNLFMNYNENMRLYQHNLSLMFRHLQSLSRNSTVVSSSTSSNNNNTSRTRPRNRTFGLFSNLQDNLALDIQSFPFYGIFPSGNSEPSHSIPTIQQFTNATEMCTYTHESLGIISRTCPITLEEFQEHEQVHKIKHCGHFFKTIPLQNWFSRNSHCPVCRYDIRTYNDEDSQQTQSSFARQGSRSNSL